LENLYPMWGEGTDGSAIGYMCRTDFEYELGNASGGNHIWPSVEDMRANCKCADSCGIVEVEVHFKRLVHPGTDEIVD